MNALPRPTSIRVEVQVPEISRVQERRLKRWELPADRLRVMCAPWLTLLLSQRSSDHRKVRPICQSESAELY